MKTNQLTINVNMGDCCKENSTPATPASTPAATEEFQNASHVIEGLTAGAQSVEEFEKAIEKAGFASLKVNPFLARSLKVNPEFHQIIGDGCIMIPTIFRGPGGGGHPLFLRTGQSAPVGIVVSETGVYESRIHRTSGRSEQLRPGDEAVLAFRNAEGRTVLKMEMEVLDGKGDGEVILTAKKCPCGKVVVVILEAIVEIIKLVTN